MRTPVKLLSTPLLVALAVGSAATAHATPPRSVSASVLSKQTVDGKDYIVSDITIEPGGSTGWHTHEGLIYGIVKTGVLTHYGSDCKQDGAFGPGTPITDPTGADHVHIGRNEGKAPLVLEVTYVDPAGAPTSDSTPSPGCNFD
ncbi:cupin [Mycolicibacterium smegmatis]|uniref:Cupin 2, conserved barrel n=1 Tax=Mycolicibacterium smegmatis (strain ATCC 700084 / mc(2)155) TaxID=246196 RepID=I7G6C2_MYCS2|nr:Cupin 2, conserved barrel [Mycolicibacterium smegmatis MC2 155]AIU06978.1 cupin [Mycolicibacterium smegmatis MC2 155]AIU13603.1 cupin [Mycolicibacterium smegmatis]AIU20227.1 cupin [Mycolicibacterium smegmatis]